MNENLVTILLYSGILSVAIPIAAGVKYFKRLDWGLRLLTLLLALSVTTDVSTILISKILNKNYHWIHHLYLPIEYTIFALIFSKWIKKDPYSRLVLYSIPVVVIFAAYNTLFLQSLNQLNSYAITLGLICYTIITLYVLYRIMAVDLGKVMKNHIFWIATGLLVFSAGDLAYFAFYPLVNKHYLIAIWAIHVILNIITHIFYSVGIICQGRKWE